VRAPFPALLGLALLALTLGRLPAAWESGNALNHVSGAWMALADDLARGTLYRPLHDPAVGFGGTRFFPLSFAAHAALLAADVPLLPGGLVLSLAAGALAVAGAARFLRRAGHGPLGALGLGALVLAGFAGQHALAAVRGDLPAAALALWGMGTLLPRRTVRPRGHGLAWASGLGPRPAAPAVLPAALLLTLAFAAKPTALAAAGAAVVFLLLARAPGRALALAAAVAVGCAAVVVGTDAASGGRFLPMMRDLGPGGLAARDLLAAPARLAARLWREDPAGLALVACAGIAFVLARGHARRRPGARTLAALWLAAALGASLVVFASPGTGVNHLLDLEVPAALLLATCALAPAWRMARPAAALAAAAGLATGALLWRQDRIVSRLDAIEEALDASAEGGPAPLLSEDPLLPLLAGERPYALDPWMLRLASQRDPALARPLLYGITEGKFRAIVLLRRADAPDADEWFDEEFGPEAIAAIRSRWTLRLVAGPYHVYRYDPGVQARTSPPGSSPP
jgi:hypothetical protein